MYHHHYPQNQFMSEEEADYRIHPHPQHHPYHRYYETPYMGGQPIVQRFVIPHPPQLRPMHPMHKQYVNNNPSYPQNKMHNPQITHHIQDENVNIFNVKPTPPTESAGINRKGISKKNNTPKNNTQEKQKTQCEANKTKAQKKVQAQRVPLKKIGNVNREYNNIACPPMVFSNDPLIGSIQQFFPSIQIEDEISTDNATLDQINALVKRLPSFYNNSMRDTMKSLTCRQEKLVCNKVKEYKPLDVFEEIIKISPDFDLKGLSIDQLNIKLKQINSKFEENQQKYLIQRQQEQEAYLKQQQEEQIQNLQEQELLLRISQTCAVYKNEDGSQNFMDQSQITESLKNPKSLLKCEEEFKSKHESQKNCETKTKVKTEQNNEQVKDEEKSKKLNSTEIATLTANNRTIQEQTSEFTCNQFSSPNKNKGFAERMSEEKKMNIVPSSNEGGRMRMRRRNSESAGRSDSQAKLLSSGINANQNLANNFISPFRPSLSTNVQNLSSNRKKLLEKSASSGCSSFKKSHTQFMDYIEDVIINTDGTFGEDDLFNKLGNNNIPIFPNNNSNKLSNLNKQNRNNNVNNRSYLMHHNTHLVDQVQDVPNQYNHNHHNIPSKSHTINQNHLENSNGSYNGNNKKYFDCNRIHNFIAEEEDYENIQPFVISQFGGSTGKSFGNNSIQQMMMSNSNQKPYNQHNNNTYNISSFLREIDEINTFPQPGFL